MKRRRGGTALPREQGACLVVLVTLFLAGAVLGSYFAANLSEAGRAYVEDYFLGAAENGIKGAWRVVALDLALLGAVLAAAFTRLGVILAPASLGAKGFLLSLLITTFVRVFGRGGYLLSLPAAVLYGFGAVTCLLLAALQAMSIAAVRTARRGRVPIDRAFFITVGVCAVVMIAAALLFMYVSPPLSRLVAGMGL